MKDFIRVIRYASRKRKIFTLAVFLSFVLSGLGLIVPVVFKEYFDLIESLTINPNQENFLRTLIGITVLYFSLLTLQSIIASLNLYIQARWWYLSLAEIMREIFEQLQTLSIDFFDTHSSGKIRERTNVGAINLVNIVDKFFRVVLLRVLFDIFAVILLYRINVIFGLLATVMIPIIGYLNLVNRRKFTKFQKEIRKTWEKFWGEWSDNISNARIVRSFTKEVFAEKKLDRYLVKITRGALAVNKTLGFLRIYRGFALDLTRVVAISFGVYQIYIGNLTLGSFVLAYTYLDKALGPLQDIAQVIEEIQKDLVSTKLLFDFLDEKPTVQDMEGAVNLRRAKGEVRFSNVYYAYKDRKVLNSLSLTVNPGETVAFVGKSGAGKTTIMKLLLRLYDVDRGSIQVDGINIKNITQRSLRKNIATVFQDAYLFNDTVKNNIRYGKERVSQKEITNSLKLANADLFVKKLKKGVNTLIGERGVKLSGGEQQRISIARAIIKDAPIIILDEATSSLDSESELINQRPAPAKVY
jgi:ABC-type multidrug transport system fused ATPase/permease subunit